MLSEDNKDHQRMMVDPMFMIVQSLRSFLTVVTTTAVAPRTWPIVSGLRPQLVRRLVVAVLRCRLPLAGSDARNKPGSQISVCVKFAKPPALGISSVLVLHASASQHNPTNVSIRIGSETKNSLA